MIPTRYTYFIGGFAVAGVTPEEQQERLNHLGLQGWELIAVASDRHQGRNYNLFYFRREYRVGRGASPRRPLPATTINP